MNFEETINPYILRKQLGTTKGWLVNRMRELLYIKLHLLSSIMNIEALVLFIDPLFLFVLECCIYLLCSYPFLTILSYRDLIGS